MYTIVFSRFKYGEKCIQMHKRMHDACIMFNKIMNALYKIYFALKKDTPLDKNANHLILHNAFAYVCTHAHFMMHACN